MKSYTSFFHSPFFLERKVIVMKRTVDDKGFTLEEFLQNYKAKDYPKPSVTADIVLFSIKENKVQVLLIKRGGHPFLDHWALPGGFAESDETIFDTAKRELYEETSIKDIPIEEIGVFSSPNRDPRSWTMTDSFLAIVEKDKIKPIAGDDAKDAKWFDIKINDSDDKVKLVLSNKDENEIINIELEKNITKGVTKNNADFKIISNDGLAFDHGEIICKALTKIGFIIC